MSIRVMTAIWDAAPYKGGTLLVLLAMADFADDNGGSIFPTIPTLAKKARLDERQVRNVLRLLRDDGVLELTSEATGRPGRSNHYKINLERVKKLPPSPEAEQTEEVSDTDGGNSQQGRGKSVTETGEISDSYIDNRQKEPSKESSEEPSGPLPVEAGLVEQTTFNGFAPPVAKPASQPKPPKRSLATVEKTEVALAFDLYDQQAEISGWSKCQLRSDMRTGHMRRRLQEIGGIEGWRAALAKAAGSDFLCGRAPPREGYSTFKLDLDFLLQQKSFIRLMEGKYDNRDSPKGSGGVLDAASRVAAARAARAAH